MASVPAVFGQARPGGATTSKDYTGGAVTDSRNTGFGVKGGYNLSNFYGSGKDVFPGGRNSLNTFHAGVYGQFGFNDFSSVQVELLYSRKGIRSNTGAGDFDRRLDYLSLPVLYVGNLTRDFSFHVGPEISLLTKVKSNGNDQDLEANGYNSVDFSGVAGLEYRIGPARVGARYDLGLGRVGKDGTKFTSSIAAANGSDTSVHNQTFQVYVGIGLTQ